MSTVVSQRMPRLYTALTKDVSSSVVSGSRSMHVSASTFVPTSSPSSAAASAALRASNSKTAASGNAPAVTRPLRMIMFGKPGAGKGTLSTRLVERYEVEPISTGDLLRAEVRAQTDLGREAEAIMARGGIVDDHLVLQLVSNKLNELRNRGVRNWILDGFPRTLGQGQLLDPLLSQLGAPLNLVVNLNVPDEVILSRIADRWIHTPSGRVYNSGYNKPKVPGLDDITGEPLSKRPDDRPEVAAKRLATFYETTSPLLDYYSSQAITPMSSMTPRSSPSLSSIKPQAHAAGANALLLTSITGRTSDEIWPNLESLVTKYFGVKERRGTGGSGGGSAKKNLEVERSIDISAVDALDKARTKNIKTRATASL